MVTTRISFFSEKFSFVAWNINFQHEKLSILDKNSIKLASQTFSWPQKMLSTSLPLLSFDHTDRQA